MNSDQTTDIAALPAEAPTREAPTASLPMPGWTSGRFFLVVAGLLAVFHAKLLAGFQTLFYRDFGVLGYPFVFFHRQSLWQGEFPFWNPLSNSGAPFMAQWGTMTLYPFSAIYLLLPLPWSLSLFSLAHMAWGGWGMWHLARRWTNHPEAAALAGVIYVFNGIGLSCMTWPNYIAALAWLPWVVLTVEKAAQQGGRPVVWAALASAMQLMLGVPEVVLFTWLALGVLLLAHRPSPQTTHARCWIRLACVVALAAGLSAVQLIPFFDFLADSHRDRNFVTDKWAMPAWGWANFLVPLFRYFVTPQGTYFQFGQTFLWTYYMGLFVLVLVLWALIRCRQDRRVLALGGLLAFSLIMALGPNGYVYGWIRDLLPMVSLGRFAVKFVILAAFVVPLLAAFAVRDWLSAPQTDSRAVPRLLAWTAAAVAAGSLVLAWSKAAPLQYDQWEATWKNTAVRWVVLAMMTGLFIAWRNAAVAQRRMTIQILLLCLIAWEARYHLPRLNPTLPAYAMTPDMWEEVQDRPAPQLGQSRLMITREAESQLLLSQVPDLQQEFATKRLAEWSNLNILDGIPKVNGSSTLLFRRQADWHRALYEDGYTPTHAILDFLAVSTISAPGQVTDWTNRTSAMPWITAGQAPVTMDAADALEHLFSDAFRPRDEVLIEPEYSNLLSGVQGGQAQLISSKVGAQRMEFQIQADQPSVVVIAQTYHDAWRASTETSDLPVLRANYAFTAVVVPAGRHAVTLRYSDSAFRWGLLITGLAALVCLAGTTKWFRSPSSPRLR